MNSRLWLGSSAFLILALVPTWLSSADLAKPAPEIEERPAAEWVNSKPLKLAELKGKVVVLHFWTFGCINCIRNQPHYKSWHEKFARKNVVQIGVHTPEGAGERDLEALKKSVEEKGLKYPIVMDPEGKTWKAWGNRYWPTTYLIDKRGILRYRWEGEMNWRTAKGEAFMRRKIAELLAEPGPGEPPRVETD